MRRVSILQRFYGGTNAMQAQESVKSVERVLKYHNPFIEKYLGVRFPKNVKRLCNVVKALSEQLIEPNEVVYKDFREMVNGLISRVLSYLADHPDEEEINQAIENYKSEELVGLKFQLDEANARMRKIVYDLEHIFNEQSICVAEVKKACKRAREINKGINKNKL